MARLVKAVRVWQVEARQVPVRRVWSGLVMAVMFGHG